MGKLVDMGQWRVVLLCFRADCEAEDITLKMPVSRGSWIPLIGLLLVLAGCGQKGDLYLPDADHASRTTLPGPYHGIG